MRKFILVFAFACSFGIAGGVKITPEIAQQMYKNFAEHAVKRKATDDPNIKFVDLVLACTGRGLAVYVLENSKKEKYLFFAQYGKELIVTKVDSPDPFTYTGGGLKLIVETLNSAPAVISGDAKVVDGGLKNLENWSFYPLK